MGERDNLYARVVNLFFKECQRMSLDAKSPIVGAVELDHGKLLGFDDLGAAADDATLRGALDAAHNKVGDDPDGGDSSDGD